MPAVLPCDACDCLSPLGSRLLRFCELYCEVDISASHNLRKCLFLFGQRSKKRLPRLLDLRHLRSASRPHHFCFAPRGDSTVIKQQKQHSHHGEAGGRRNVSLLCCHERRWACGGSGPVVSRLGGAPFCSCAERGLPEVVSNWVSLWAGWVAGPPFPHMVRPTIRTASSVWCS